VSVFEVNHGGGIEGDHEVNSGDDEEEQSKRHGKRVQEADDQEWEIIIESME